MDEAAVARGALEQEGIETFLANEHMVTLVWTLSQATGGVRLSVASKDAEGARKILGFLAFPPLFQLWALWLLRRAYSEGGPRTERGRILASRALLVSACAATAFIGLYVRVFLH